MARRASQYASTLAGLLAAATPASAADIGNSLGITFVVPPPDSAVTETTEGALLSDGNPTPVMLRIRRTGRSIAITNDKAEFVCEVSLDRGRDQKCFGRSFVVDTVFPLPRLGAAPHPFVAAATVGNWAVAIYAGLDGVAPQDRCRRFVTTISQAAYRLAHAVCPDDSLTMQEALPGTVLEYDAGTTQAQRRYSVQIPPQPPAAGIAALSHVLASLVRCDSIAQLINTSGEQPDLSCDRSGKGMAWRDTIAFVGSNAMPDRALAATFRSYRLTIAGTSGNTHHSVAETEIWLQAGVPFRTRYTVQAGRGPDGLAPATEYVEALKQITLPPP